MTNKKYVHVKNKVLYINEIFDDTLGTALKNLQSLVDQYGPDMKFRVQQDDGYCWHCDRSISYTTQPYLTITQEILFTEKEIAAAQAKAKKQQETNARNKAKRLEGQKQLELKTLERLKEKYEQ